MTVILKVSRIFFAGKFSGLDPVYCSLKVILDTVDSLSPSWLLAVKIKINSMHTVPCCEQRLCYYYYFNQMISCMFETDNDINLDVYRFVRDFVHNMFISMIKL